MPLDHQVILNIDPKRDHPDAQLHWKQLLAQGKTPETAQSVCRLFCEWLATNRLVALGHSPVTVDLSKVTPDDVNAYVGQALCSKSYNTVRCKLITLKRWFRFLFRRGIIGLDPTASIPNLSRRREKATWRILSEQQVDAFMSAILTHSENPLFDVTVYGLMSSLGLRAREILLMAIEDVKRDTDHIIVLGKGNKPRLLPLDGVVRDILYMYLQARLPGNPKEPLWQLPGQKPLSYDRLLRRFHLFRELAGIPETVSATHAFRHYFATQQLLEGRDLEVVAMFMGHSSPRELEPYFHLSEFLLRDRIYRAYGFKTGAPKEGEYGWLFAVK